MHIYINEWMNWWIGILVYILDMYTADETNDSIK